MCEPTSIVMIGVAVAGAVMKGVADKKAGAAAQGQSNYQAQVAKNNAVVAGWQSHDALQRSGVEQVNFARQVEGLQARQKANFAANGLDVGSGSPLSVLGDTAMLGEMDLSTMRANAQREAIGLHNQSSAFASEAGLLKMQGQSQAAAGRSAMWTGIIMGAAQAGASAYGASKYAAVPGTGNANLNDVAKSQLVTDWMTHTGNY